MQVLFCSFLAKVLVPDGSKDVPVGQPIAIMVGFASILYSILITRELLGFNISKYCWFYFSSDLGILLHSSSVYFIK